MGTQVSTQGTPAAGGEQDVIRGAGRTVNREAGGSGEDPQMGRRLMTMVCVFWSIVRSRGWTPYHSSQSQI